MAVLRVRKGKRPGTVHAVFTSHQPTTLGRDATNEVQLDDDRASRHHARILCLRGSWILQDLGSSNGTLLLGKRVEHSELEPGQSLQIGNTLLAFEPDELAPLPDNEIYGARILTTLYEESGVFVYRAFQSAMDREIRIDQLHPGRRGRWPADLMETATHEARSIRHEGIDALVDVRLHRDEKQGSSSRYVVLRHSDNEDLLSLLDPILASPWNARVTLFRDLADAVLARAEHQSLLTPVAPHQIRCRLGEHDRWRVSVPAVDLPALVTWATGSLPHLPQYAAYLPPELATEQEAPIAVRPESLAYSLGAIGHELLTGRKHSPDGKATAPADAPSELADGFVRLFRGLLSPTPQVRPKGRGELLRRLDELVAESGRSAPTAPPASHGRAAKTPSRVRSRRVRPRRGGNMRTVASLPFWGALWVGLFFGGRVLAKVLFQELLG